MPKRKHSYDEECERLAWHFLQDEPGATRLDAEDLAQRIQEEIEDWIEFDFRAKRRAADAP